MAVLEFEFKGIDQNFRSSASNVLNDIDKIKKAFGSIGVGEINVSGIKKSMDEVTASIKKAESDNKMFLANEMNQAKINILQVSSAVKNDLSSSLNQAKVNFVEAKKATQDMVTEGKNLDNQYKQTKVAIAELTLEQKKLTAEQRASRANLQDSPYSKLSRELNEMRNEAKNLGAQMILLDNAGMKSGVVYNTLSNKFNIAQKSANSLDNQIKSLDSSLGQNNRRVGAYGNAVGGLQQKMTGVNGVTLEFNRIIQDAPFGMMGIGNNIQQLTENWKTLTQQMQASAQAQGRTVTTSQMLGYALGGIISPVNLLSLGISAVTSGWILYEKYQQQANKSMKEAKKDSVDLMQTIREQTSVLGQASAQAQANYVAEEHKLNALWKITQDVSSSVKQRKNALKELQDLYPSVFKNLDIESVKNQKAKNDYLDLAKAIQLSAKARSFESKLAEQYGKKFDLSEYIKENEKLYTISARLRKETQQFAGGKSVTLFDAIFGDAEQPLADFNKGFEELQKSRNELGKTEDTIKSLTDSLNDLYAEQAKGLGFGTPGSISSTNARLSESFDYLSKIKDLISGRQEELDLFGLKGEAKELQELKNSYVDFFNELDKLQKKLNKDTKVSNKAFIQQQINNAKSIGENLKNLQQDEISNKWIKERTDLIDEMYSKIEDIGQSGLDKALSNWYKEVDVFKNKILETGVPLAQFESTIQDLQERGSLKIKIDFAIKDLEEIDKLEKSVQDLIDKPFKGSNKNSTQRQLDERIKLLTESYDKLVDAMRKSGIEVSDVQYKQGLDKVIGTLKANLQGTIDLEQAKKDIQDYVSIANNGLNSVFTNLKGNIDEFGLKASSVFFALGETIGDMIKQLANKNTTKFMEKLTKDAKSFGDLAENWKGLSSNEKLGFGLGIAGSAVSSLTPQTSVGGQALGGALSGASAGMAFGPWGAAIGAVAGGISGLLKAAKNRKQEKYLIQQIEEQKKANRLLERMNALSYASQIIGQKTEYGIISGVRRNEFGQIVSVVQGQDIVMVADRTSNGKNR